MGNLVRSLGVQSLCRVSRNEGQKLWAILDGCRNVETARVTGWVETL